MICIHLVHKQQEQYNAMTEVPVAPYESSAIAQRAWRCKIQVIFGADDAEISMIHTAWDCGLYKMQMSL